LRLHFRTDDGDVTVDVRSDGEDWRLTIGDREVPLQATRDADGSWLVETHQGRRRLWVAVRGDERLVFCDGRAHTLRLPDAEHDDAAEEQPGGGPRLVADMPGKVVRVLVAEGDSVAAGQPVLIMESMKMETELAAAVAGTVAAVHVAADQVVGQGDPLVDITPASGDAGPETP
jgi:3-methylcrotonyl-CoA carboxylase alpha subunit